MIDQVQLREALSSELEPITVYKQPVFPCNGSPDPVAYRTETVLNSTLVGRLTPEDYQSTADKSKRGILLADRTLYSVCRAISLLPENETRIKWFSLYCPVSMITGTDLVETLGKLFGGDKEKLKKLMLEFPVSALYEDSEKLRGTLLDMKLLGVKSALAGYGTEFCPMMRLASFPFDYVILDPEVRELMSRDAKAAETLIAYARSLRIEVVVTGVENGEQEAPSYYRADCFGYTDNSEKERLLPESKVKVTADGLTSFYIKTLKEQEERNERAADEAGAAEE